MADMLEYPPLKISDVTVSELTNFLEQRDIDIPASAEGNKARLYALYVAEIGGVQTQDRHSNKGIRGEKHELAGKREETKGRKRGGRGKVPINNP